MTVWVLLAVGALFVILSGLNSLLKTIFRRTTVGFVDLLLVFAATLILVAVLIVANMEETPDTRIGVFVLYAAAGMALSHLFVSVLEVFRPERLKASRGLLGIFGGLLIGLSTLTVPFSSVYFALRVEQQAARIERTTPSPEAVVADAGGVDNAGNAASVEVTPSYSATPSEQQRRFAELFRTIFGVVADETKLSELEIVDQLEAGTPLAKIVTDHGGNLDSVVHQIADATRAVVRESAASGDMNPVQAALAVSQMDTLVRFLVNSDITKLGERFGGGTPDPSAARPSLRSLFVTPDAPEANDAPTVTEEAAPDTPTALPSATASPILTPTSIPTIAASATAEPRITETPSATRFVYSTRTPTPTLTPVTPCIASVEYNLRLRSAPNMDSDTLLVIPYGTTVELFGRGPASTADADWWLARYEGSEGWLDGQYMLVSRACDLLPTVAVPRR